MAAIGKIRSWGPILVVIIGLALFAFIAEELVRSCNSGNQAEARRVGTIYGNNIDIDEFNKLVDEYKNAKKLNSGDENLQDGDYDQLWQSYVSNALYEHEAEELGLTVTDEELQNVLKEGTNQTLVQSGIFVNQKTGRFDANELKKFLDQYEKLKSGNGANGQQLEMAEMEYKYWMFIERSLRQALLAQKYQMLLAACCLSNSVEDQMAFNDQNEESNIDLASIAYSTIKDTDVKISDEELQAKYDEMKEMFRIYTPLRDIKYAMYQVVPSEADRNATKAEMKNLAAQLDSVQDPTELMKSANSNVHFLNIPLLKSSYPGDIAGRLDSAAVGKVVGPIEDAQRNTITAFKILSKQSLPDSIQYRMIMVPGKDDEASKASTDSIMTALKAGGNFAEIAKKYGNSGDSTWVTADGYVRDQRSGQLAPSIDEDTKKLILTINQAKVGELNVVNLSNGYNCIIQVLNDKKMTEKYNVAVIQRTFEFSKETRTAAYNKFSSFAAQSKEGLSAMEAAAKKCGYKVEDDLHISTSNHGIPLMTAMNPYGGPVTVPASRDALKWVFEAKEGDVSGLLECGTNRDTYMLICLTKINDGEYLTLDDKNVKEAVRSEVLKDKKAEMIIAKLQGVNSVDAAKAKGAFVQQVNQITFATPASVSPDGKTPAQEPALSGAVAGTKAGAFVSHPVKGNAGIYLFKVTSKAKTQAKYNAAMTDIQVRSKYMQLVQNLAVQLLFNNAGVVDHRYLFY